MAVEFRDLRQSHRFHSMKLLSAHGGGRSGDVHLNVTALVDMMMVLVIFLVMNFNATGEMLFLSKDMKMPLAEHGAEITRVPIISISYNKETGNQQLYFEGQVLLDLGQLDPDDPNWNISELEEKLVDNRQRFEAIGSGRAEQLNPDEDPTTTVNVQTDKHTNYKVMKRVLYTCEQAGYGRIRLTVGDGRKSDAAPHGEGGEEGGE